MVFLGFFSFSAFSDSGQLEEIDYLLFLPNSSSRFFDEEHTKIKLDALAKYFLSRHLVPGQIHVHGYAASAKNNIQPMELSRDRALIVMNELQMRGVPANLFSEPVGHGEVDTWGSNITEEDMNPNRRVRVLLAPNVLPAGRLMARYTIPAYTSKSDFPWLILLLLLLATALLAATLFFASKLRKRTGCAACAPGKTAAESIKTNNPTAAGEKAGIVDVAPMASAAVPSVTSGSEDRDWQNISNTGRSRFMDLEKVIREIISGIPTDAFFDVHTIVEKLLQEHDEVYLMSVGNYTSAAQYHSKISSIIAHEIDLVEKVGDSYSKNIHDKFSECHLFRRKK